MLWALAPTAVCQVSGWRLVGCRRASRKGRHQVSQEWCPWAHAEPAVHRQLPEGHVPYDGPYSTAPGECAAYDLLQSGWVLGDCATCCLQVEAFLKAACRQGQTGVAGPYARDDGAAAAIARGPAAVCQVSTLPQHLLSLFGCGGKSGTGMCMQQLLPRSDLPCRVQQCTGCCPPTLFHSGTKARVLVWLPYQHSKHAACVAVSVAMTSAQGHHRLCSPEKQFCKAISTAKSAVQTAFERTAARIHSRGQTLSSWGHLNNRCVLRFELPCQAT